MTIIVIESDDNDLLQVMAAAIEALTTDTDIKHLDSKKVLVAEGDFEGPDTTYTMTQGSFVHKNVGVDIMYAFGPSDPGLAGN